jgi:hypothetical protein
MTFAFMAITSVPINVAGPATLICKQHRADKTTELTGSRGASFRESAGWRLSTRFWPGGTMFKMARYPSGKGGVCKTFMRRFDSDPRLHLKGYKRV